MAELKNNPFDDEKPKIVHLEKSESHYEYCRMQMHDIEKVHRRTFICNVVLCIFVCFLSIFKRYIAMFDLLSRPMLDLDKPQATLTGGIFQILFGMMIVLLGYLAWANYRTLNIILGGWYAMVTLLGVFRLEYLSALIGVVGLVFYFFSIKELSKEQALSQMEGYPEFHEKLDISKSDIVIQTLLAHQGERRTKSTLFTTDYSLRRKKKKNTPFGYTEPEAEKDKVAEAGAVLAETLQKRLDDVQKAKEAAAGEAEKAETAVSEAAESPAAETGMADLIPELTEQPETAPAEEAAPEIQPETKPENIEPERADAEAAAAAILAEAEARSQKILEDAEKKAKDMTEKTAGNQQPNPNRKKKKRR